jgi:hypothetical protein
MSDGGMTDALNMTWKEVVVEKSRHNTRTCSLLIELSRQTSYSIDNIRVHSFRVCSSHLISYTNALYVV